MMLEYAFSFVFSFLLIAAALQAAVRAAGGRTAGGMRTAVICVVSGAAVLVPVEGLSLARWLTSLNANFSIPLTAVLCSILWRGAFGVPLLDPRAYAACWAFGCIAGMLLYPMALGLGPFDPYALGWSFSPLFGFLMAVTLLLLFFRNRFGVVLAAAVLAYNMGLLESSNLWDYLVDPFYVLLSLGAAGYGGARLLVARS